MKKSLQSPEVSIILPALNEEKYIGAALSSIRRSKCSKSYEIIVGDGLSTDKTAKIARDLGARVVSESFKTPSGGRAAASNVAKGKILVFTGSDVEVHDEWLERITAAFADKKVSWALGSVSPLDGNAIDNFITPGLQVFAVIMGKIGLPYVYAENMACTAAAYKKSGGWDPKAITAEDTDFAKRLRKTGKFAWVGAANVKCSMRRVRKWGYWKFITFHTANFLRSHFLQSAATRYDPVR